MTTEPVERTPPNPILKLAIEIGPLVAFFIANSRWGIITGTGVFMVATIISLSLSLGLFRRIPILPLATAVFVLFFGGLTVILNDDFFIKIKPTVVNTLFGVLDKEQERAQAAGYEAVTFGPRILRTETAALAAIASLQSLFGDLGGQL